MPGQSPLATMPPPISAETRSAITVLDFFRLWFSYRQWFIAGLVIVTCLSFAWTKLFITKYFRAESRFYVGQQNPPDVRIGFADVEGNKGVGRNEQYQSVVQAALAEQFLTSSDLLTSVTARLNSPALPPEQRIDLYQLLKINEKNEERRKAMLIYELTTNLMRVMPSQNTGIVSFTAELPDPVAAARFVNACVAAMQERFTRMDFGYFDDTLGLYLKQRDEATSLSQQLAAQLHDLEKKSFYDINEEAAQQKMVIRKRLEMQAEWIAKLEDKIDKYRLATSRDAKKAAQPIVMQQATIPLKKSRPQTILSTFMAQCLYVFFFLLGMVVLSYVRWVESQRSEQEGDLIS